MVSLVAHLDGHVESANRTCSVLRFFAGVGGFTIQMVDWGGQMHQQLDMLLYSVQF